MDTDAAPNSQRAPWRDVLLLVASVVLLVDRINSDLFGPLGNWHVWARWAAVIMFTCIAVGAVRSLVRNTGH